jgi:HEAT repeat protein
MSEIQNDPRSTRELVNIVLASDDEDDADSAYWNALNVLRRRGTTEVFEAARSLCESACPLEQRAGCDILSQLGGSDSPFALASFPVVLSVVRKTEDLDTLASAICALGWFGDLRGVDHVLPFLDHRDPDIRFWVTYSLTALAEDQRSIDGLIRLTTDSSVKVRDWATFGLGSLTEQDSPAIRQALVTRLGDPDDIVRGEALVGLAKRQDQRVVEPLRRALEAEIYKNMPNDYAREALDALDLNNYPQLMKWKTNA